MTCSLQKIAQHWMQSGHQTEASFVESGARISLLLTARVRISSSAELTSDQRDPVRPGRRQTQAEMPPRCRGGFLRLFKPRQGEPGKPRKEARMARGSRPRVSGAAWIPARPGPRAPPHLQGPFMQVLLSVCPFDQGGERPVCTFWPPGGPPLPPTPILGRPRLLATRAAGRKDMRPRAACLPSGQRTQTPRQCGWQSSDARKGGGRRDGRRDRRACAPRRKDQTPSAQKHVTTLL